MNAAIAAPSSLAQAFAAAARVRPEIGQERLALGASLYFSLFCNAPFWREPAVHAAVTGSGGWLLAASLFVAMTALSTILLCVLFTRWTAKPVLAVFFAVTAAAVYFTARYAVYIDSDMVRNVLHTDTREAGELLAPSLFWHLALLAGPPIVLLWRLRLKARPLGRGVAIRIAWLAGSVLTAALAILLSFQNLSSLMRNHHDVRFLIAPGNWVVSLATVALEGRRGIGDARIPVGRDARVTAGAAARKPRLLVIVVGETARARNWGLDGYRRETTPRLRAIDPVNFADVTACGTSTEISLPCMFSPYGRAHYDKALIERSESLLHVLDHAGIGTLWLDNQSGCKGVCDGLAYESFANARDARYCDASGCLDQAMLRALADPQDASARDRVIVLHQLGNHGPSYFKRYPAAMRRFVPACESSDLALCTRESIVNAYDNAILNTDDFVARAIGALAAIRSHDTALIYLSDHGESLGEHGLYLHGIPYAIAPDTQKKVPMVLWLSPGMSQDRGVDIACLRKRAASPASHDNLFHSVLGLMQVETSVYARNLDLFADCATAGAAPNRAFGTLNRQAIDTPGPTPGGRPSGKGKMDASDARGPAPGTGRRAGA